MLHRLFVVVLPLLLVTGPRSSVAADNAPEVPKGRRVTLKAEGQLLSKVLTELADRTGLKVESRLGTDPRISVDVKDVPFWEALDRIAAAAGARVDVYSADKRLALVTRPPGYQSAPVHYSGPFRTTMKRLVTARDFESGGHTCTSYLEVAWEPDLHPFFLETRPRDLMLRDDKGQSFAGADLGSSQAPVDGQLAQTFDVPLPALPRAAARIGVLQGQLTAIAPSKMLTFSFDNTLDKLARLVKSDPSSEDLRQTKDGVTCTITRVTLEKSRWTIQVSMRHPRGGVSLDSSQAQSLAAANELSLHSRSSNKQQPVTRYILESQTPERTVLSYHFLDKDLLRSEPGSWKVSYRAPAAVVEVPFSFAFKDVLLP